MIFVISKIFSSRTAQKMKLQNIVYKSELTRSMYRK